LCLLCTVPNPTFTVNRMQALVGPSSIFACGWLYGLIFSDLLRDSLSLLPSRGTPERLKQLEQIQDFYSHGTVGYGPLWTQGFLGHAALLIVLSLMKLANGFSLRNAMPGLCVLGIVVLNLLFLDRAKKTLKQAKGEVAISQAGQKIFYVHSIMAGICVLHFICSL